MGLVLNSTYKNVSFDFVLDGLRDILISEFDYGKIYISPKIKHSDPFQIKIWLNESELLDYTAQDMNREFTARIDLYMIDKNHNENTYKQLFQDTERLVQLLFNNAHKEITSGGNTLNWINGVAEDYIIDDFLDDEEEIDGLTKSTISFKCIIRH
tara:strand:- start:115 stop:579 length:465 start_codon:yes stop_codon:yes gene_type:complete